MKTINTKFFIGLIFQFIIMINQNVKAQNNSIPAELTSLVNLSLEEGQKKLVGLGYEVCASSLFKKKQDWFNDSTKICVTILFNKKQFITDVLNNPNTTECQKGLEASRKVWESYHDGQAPIHSDKIDEERKKLIDKGYKVSYWINGVSPGRDSEYWVNETSQKTMYIVWEIDGNKWVMTESTDYTMGKNPAPHR